MGTFLATGEVEITGKKKTLEELLALRAKYQASVQSLIEEGSQKSLDSLILELEKSEIAIDKQIANIESSLSESLNTDGKGFNEEIKNLQERYKAGLIGVKAFIKQGTKLQDDASIERLRKIGEALDKEIDLLKEANDRKLKAEAAFQAALEKLRKAKPGSPEEQDALKEVAFTKEELDKATSAKDKLDDLKSKKNSNDVDQVEDAATKRVRAIQREMEMWQMRFDLISSLENKIADIIQQGFDARLRVLDQESAAIDAKDQRERGIIEQTVKDETEKQKRLADLDLKTLNQKEIIEKKKRKVEHDAAKAKKLTDSAAIIIDTIATITKLSLLAALYAAEFNFPGQALALSQIPFAVAQGAIGLASIASAPLPKLALGDPDFEGGPVIMGDAWKHELVTEPDGSMWVTADKPTEYNIPKHSRVDPDADKALKDLSIADKIPNRIYDDQGIEMKIPEKLKREINYDVAYKYVSNESVINNSTAVKNYDHYTPIILPKVEPVKLSMQAAQQVPDQVIRMQAPDSNNMDKIDSTLKKGFDQIDSSIQKNKPVIDIKGVTNAELLLKYGHNWWKYIS